MYWLEIIWYKLARWFIQHRIGIGYSMLPSGKAIVPHAYGGEMVFDFSNPREIEMFADVYDVSQLGRLMKDILRPGDIFIDCGANIGYYTSIAAALVGRSGRVISVEANPDLSLRMANGAVINGANTATVHLTNALLGSESGRAILYIAEDHIYSSTCPVDELKFRDIKKEREISVHQITMDALLKQHRLIGRRIRLVKIDVEGSEMDVLRGFKLLYSGFIDFIYIEIHPEQLAIKGQSPLDVAKFMFSAGYVVKTKIDNSSYLYGRK
jgi:FkbM family methyltransferase